MVTTLAPPSSAPVRREATPLALIFKGSVWNGVAVVVSRFSPGILTVVLARWLEPRALGSISFVLAYYGVFALVADWSIAYAVQKLIPENPLQIGEIAWTALALRLFFSLALGFGCWTLDSFVGVFHGFGITLAIVLIGSAFGTIVSIQNAACNFGAGALLAMAFQGGWLAISLILVRMGMTTQGPLLALPIVFVCIGLPAFLFSRSEARPIRLSIHFARQILSFGSWATLATLLSGFADQVGILVVAYKNGDTAAAIFKIATTFGVVPALLGIVVVTPLMPVAKQTLLQGKNVSSTLVEPILGYLLMFGLPIAAAGAVLAPAIIRAFVRDTYLSAVWPMRILLATSVLRMLVSAFSGILFVAHGTKDLVKIHGTIASIALIGSVIWSGTGGAVGVALSLLAAWLTGTILLYRWFRAQVLVKLEWPRYLRYAVSSVVASVLLVFALPVLHSAWSQLVIGSGLALLSYILILRVQKDPNLLRLLEALRLRIAT